MKNILVVDDSPTIRTAVKFALKGDDYQILEAENGTQALAIIKDNTKTIDIMLTDINMPAISGIELIIEMRKTDKFTPILVLTTEAGSDMVQKGKEAGASGWLVKPFQPKILLETIKKFI